MAKANRGPCALGGGDPFIGDVRHLARLMTALRAVRSTQQAHRTDSMFRDQQRNDNSLTSS
jgi:hypothetical protein